MKLDEPPDLRQWEPSDEQERNLVLAGWLTSYVGGRKGGPAGSHVPKGVTPGVEPSVFFRLYQPVVKALLERSTVLCAVMPDNPGIVYGWMAWEGEVLHYINVKPKWQRLGIATWLLKDFMDKRVTYTHRTKDSMALPLPETWEYHPMMRFGLEAA